MRRSTFVGRAAWFAAGLGLGALLAHAAAAHSLEDVAKGLAAREKFFQTVDKPAPDFTLGDAAGRVVKLSDFRGHVVVVQFIYASCPDECPLHAERLAEVQALVGQAGFKDRVRFVSITTDPENDTSIPNHRSR